MQTDLGVIIIGRNEGSRLQQCIQSIKSQLSNERCFMVYVDSGSSDDSCDIARSAGTHVIDLDLSTPFTAARARNAGLSYLHRKYPELRYVQFIDGDCELVDGWVNTALTHLEAKPELAIVCGRRREKYPNNSIYNMLIDQEWNTPVGEARYCGGDALARIEALVEVDGYNDYLICGEEPEMCIRLRKKNWKIERIDAEMTLHDAALIHFRQWWKRAVRGGWAVSEGYWMHGSSDERYMKKEHRSGWLWGLCLPMLSLFLMPLTHGLSLYLLMAYPALTSKILLNRVKNGDSAYMALLYAAYCVLSKFPQMIGQAKYYWHMVQMKQGTIIEYK